MSEMERIWDLMQRSFEGDVWHGPALRPLLQEVTAEEDAARRRLEGEPLDTLPPRQSWPLVEDTSPDAWRAARERFEEVHRRLRRAVGEVSDSRLSDIVPGRDYPLYLLLHGVVQHALYHAGQIVLLQQAQGLTPGG